LEFVHAVGSSSAANVPACITRFAGDKGIDQRRWPI